MDKKLFKLKQCLRELNFHPSKKNGQNFLYNHEVINQIVKSVLDCGTKNIIEIGPGLGAISDQIDQRLQCEQYKLIELDHLLYAYLLKKNYSCQILQGDCLKLDWFTLTSTTDFLFFGNLPYCCGTLILMKWLNFPYSRTAIFMLQKEVVERLLALPSQKEYSSVSVISQLSSDVSPLFFVPRTAFYPEPNVDSILIKLVKKTVLDVKLQNFIRLCFAYKRKTLFNNLYQTYPKTKIINAIRHFGLKEKIRAEEIQASLFADLYTYFCENL